MTLSTLDTLTRTSTKQPRVRVHRPREFQLARWRSATPTTVLVAEDDWDTRRMLVDALLKEGYQVVEAEDGRQLVRCLADPKGQAWPRPELVISDIRMPGHAGMDVLAALRDSDWSLPVILITAFGDSGTHEEARRLGVAIVIDKPFDVDDMIHAARAVMPAKT